ncbi:MAG TPA: ABC transporter permease [Alphaproteobacteria bacterium]|nr:ABC transporter permease [Alphaproteobacteria bacterium]
MTQARAAADGGIEPRTVAKRGRSRFLEVWVRLIREKPLGLLGACIVFGLLGVALFADVIAPYGYAQTNLLHRFQGSSTAHWMGTDQLGRDLLSRVIYGTRVSLTVSLGAAGLGILLATLIGVTSAFFGGRYDLGVQRFVDAWEAFPGLLLLLTIMSLLGPGLYNVTLVLGLSFGIQNSRIIRGAALSVKENAYIEAAQAFGSSSLRIMLLHMLPNVAAIIIVVATIGLGNLILVEASLSFLGFGVPPPHPTWGGMLSLQGLNYMYQAPWLAIWPGVALSAAVFGFNMFGDALRDLLDPRLRGGQ